jgi:CheY-like chemotaxis protein
VADPIVAEVIDKALQADGIRVILAEDASSALRLLVSASPSLIMLEEALPELGGLEVCRRIRATGTPEASEVPIIIMTPQEDLDAGAAVGVTDWLIEPFSGIYARTRVRAWLLRACCRWIRPPVPEDEEPRLAALHQLGVLDTRPEERFDRLTRLASALFHVPVSLVSLIDRDRQWLKSCHGCVTRETPREMSFCAHAILERAVMVVPDALLDPRFADNPQVADEPRIRFYAGYPLILPSGGCAGTLCIIDTQPHQLDEAAVRLLQDLGHLVERELAAGG